MYLGNNCNNKDQMALGIETITEIDDDTASSVDEFLTCEEKERDKHE
jgi:hypothetical protein